MTVVHVQVGHYWTLVASTTPGDQTIEERGRWSRQARHVTTS